MLFRTHEKTKTTFSINWSLGDQFRNFLRSSIKNDLSKIGICYSHFLYDHNQLHNANIKQANPIEKS